MRRSFPIVLAALGTLAAATAFGALVLATSAGAAAAEQGCVEKLLDQPRPTRTVVEASGSRPTISVAFAYPAVGGCDYLERLPGMRFQVKHRGGPWEYLTGKSWILFRAAPGSANGEREIEKTIGGPRLDLSCERGHRPRFRVEVRTQAKIVASHRFEGTSGSSIHQLAYEPTGSARC